MQTDLLETRIETDRLLLVPISPDYLWNVYQEFTEKVTTFMYPRPAADIGETSLFITSSLDGLKKGTNLQTVILKKDTSEFLGCAGLHELQSQNPELGIWIKESAHGNHYGFEAIEGLKNWAEEHLQYKALLYPVDERNTPSKLIPERLGGRITHSRKVENMSGRTLHIVFYEIDNPKLSDR